MLWKGIYLNSITQAHADRQVVYLGNIIQQPWPQFFCHEARNTKVFLSKTEILPGVECILDKSIRKQTPKTNKSSCQVIFAGKQTFNTDIFCQVL